MQFLERMMNDPTVRQRFKASEERRVYCEEKWAEQENGEEVAATPTETAPEPEPEAEAEGQEDTEPDATPDPAVDEPDVAGDETPEPTE